MLVFMLFLVCNVFLIIDTIRILNYLSIKDKPEKFVSGILIYFIRIIVFELLLGYLLKNMTVYTVTIISTLEFFILTIINFIKLDEKFKKTYIKDKIEKIKNFNLKNINADIKMKFNINSLTLIITIITFIIISLISLVIYEYSFDGNYYHLPHIIDYIQKGQIYLTNNTLWNNVYPQNIELLNMFYMMFTSSIFLARLPQILFSIVGILVVYKLIIELEFDKKIAFQCGIIYFVSPFILAQITTTYIDGIVATLFLTLLLYLIKIFKHNKLKDEIMYFVSLSIFMGVKGTCTIYAILISLIYIVFKIYMVYIKKEKLSILIKKWSVFLIIVILIGCTWMIQNIYYFKNPIHPFKFMNTPGLDANIDIGVENEPKSIQGKSQIKKVMISWLGLDSSLLEYYKARSIKNLVQTHDSRIGGLGIAWMYFLLPISVISIYFIFKKKYKINKYQILIIGVSIIAFLITPANWWGRYVGFILIVGLIFYAIFKTCLKNELIKKLLNIIYFVIIIGSIFLSTKYSISIFLDKSARYAKYDTRLTEYINSTENKSFILLETSYHNTQEFVYLKGDKFQNKLSTYYINEMYPNEQVKNHNIGSYENFKNIVLNYEDLDGIIILDASHNRTNSKFLEQYYNENLANYKKVSYGEDILIYEKVY